MVCSLDWQLIPLTLWPVAIVAVLASGGALGTGRPSGPVGPGDGAGASVPRVLSGASLGRGEPPPVAAPPPPETASVMPTAAAATTTTAAVPASQRRRRRRCASCALIWASLSRAFCRSPLALDPPSPSSSACPPDRTGHTARPGGRRARPPSSG